MANELHKASISFYFLGYLLRPLLPASGKTPQQFTKITEKSGYTKKEQKE
jgi:hypothetical protein